MAAKILSFSRTADDPRPPARPVGARQLQRPLGSDLRHERIYGRLERLLPRLDAEQVQIAEIVFAAMIRGGRKEA